MIFPPHQTLFA